ncbi:MAG: succinylglutamate desuccinylase/aspartoacylase family protein [Candidatus Uhrbacteria bacterium]|nr:succinylglutamate desuccinylase/aspartoacylase family protein [Candidatus Uhrbacteria bacterium]
MLRDWFSGPSDAKLKTVRVDLGSRVLRMPVADLRGNKPGKTLLITGGMDGDEYAGIEAAYQLAKKFQACDFAGRLVVIPIVNLPGFEAECSLNPLDHRYPKFVFPGRCDGSPTERLIHWLVTTYVQEADVWRDLHGGSLTERMTPFLWTFETGVASVDAFMKTLHATVPAEPVLFERAERSSKAARLARRGCVYVLAESGDRIPRAEDVTRHREWVECLMGLLGMIKCSSRKLSSASTILRRVYYAEAPFDGLWYLEAMIPDRLNKGEPLGVCVRRDESGQHPIRSPASGRVLWWKETPSITRGDILCAIGQ